MPRPAKKVLLVGWDAADWKVIHPLMDQGKMPVLQSLVNNGVMANLATLRPQFSPMLWTSIATGKRPFKHGVLGFTEPTPDGRGVQPVTNLSRKTKAVWNILQQNGFQSNVVGWWPSHPAEPISGVMVSDHFQKGAPEPDKDKPKEWPMRPGTVHPPELAPELAELRIHPLELGPEEILPFVPNAAKADPKKDRRLLSVAKITAECSSIHAAATHLMESRPWDFMAVYFDAIDHYCHGFMKYHPPQQKWIKDEDFEIYSEVVQGAYRYHDMMLGMLLHLAGPDTTVIVMSDHGFHPDHLRPRNIPAEPAGPAIEHRDWGIFVASGPGIRRDELIHGPNLLDICPTILTLFGLPIGEDMDGKPLSGIFQDPPQIATVQSWDEIPGDSGLHPPERKLEPFESKEALDQLVALGYVEKPGDDAGEAVERTVRELRYNLARAYMDADRHAEAAELLEELYRDHPTEHRFGVYLARCYRALERPTDLRALVQRIRKGRRADAVDARKKLKEWKVEIAKRKRARGEKAADSAEAKPPLLTRKESFELRKLRGMARVNPFALDMLEGFALAAEGHGEDALAALQRAEKAEPNRPDIHLQIGEAYLRMKRWPDAERAFQRASHIDTDNPHAYLGMARALLAQRKSRLAIDEALKAVGLLYQNAYGHFILGVALHRTGRIERGRGARSRGRTQPNFPEAHLRLARIYRQRLNQPEKADEHRAFVRELRKRRIAEIEVDPQLSTAADSTDGQAPSQPTLPREQRITIVSGLPRSGTSLMMRMLQAAGFPRSPTASAKPTKTTPAATSSLKPSRRPAATASGSTKRKAAPSRSSTRCSMTCRLTASTTSS
ncbi:MAG: alkaline phosphatase family protein [Bryobacterales bacterium]